MIGDISQKTYEGIAKHWVHTITLLSESEIQVWPHLSCSFNIVNKFAHDLELQKKLFGTIDHKLIFIDGYEAEDPQWHEFENQFFYFFPQENVSLENIDQFLEKYPNTFFGVFLVGFDNAIRHGNTGMLKHIGSLLEKHSQLCIILLTEQNIVDSDSYNDLIQKHMVIENVSYQSLLSEEDSVVFLNSISKVWNFTYKKDMDKIIAENIGGHPLLLEEAARIVRDNPDIEYKELLASHSLIHKAHVIFRALNPEDQEIIRDIVANKSLASHTSLSEYLEKTHFIKENKVALQYWNYIYQNFPDEHIFGVHPTHEDHFLHVLTSLEKKVFDLLIASGKVVTRDEVAETIWGEDYADKYSDWSIDQLMHRLREKLKLTNTSYHIQTKKGEGFFLQQG